MLIFQGGLMKNRVRDVALISALSAALIAGPGLLSAVAHADANEEGYLMFLGQHGLERGGANRQPALDAGHKVCQALDSGADAGAATKAVGLSDWSNSVVAYAATHNLCTQYQDLITTWTDMPPYVPPAGPTNTEREGNFVDGLIRMGLLQSNADAGVRTSATKVGWAICGELDQGKNKADVTIELYKYHSKRDAAMWVAVAIDELCPAYK
ncbi:DUF732 domain-containing protein [Nocardia sp. NPDC051052]|uniref:DUF732 domain-containing protein n=1 Tax=Nocardia sp. NPDC051052 TaxID=3364322 RepID=UPI0037B5FE69